MKAKIILVCSILVVASLIIWLSTRTPEWPFMELREAVRGKTVNDIKEMYLTDVRNKKGAVVARLYITDKSQQSWWLKGFSRAKHPGNPRLGARGDQINRIVVMFKDKTTINEGFGANTSCDCFDFWCRKAFNAAVFSGDKIPLTAKEDWFKTVPM